jgi:outer membrane protein OmpA-like peptidoglycan-associated protein
MLTLKTFPQDVEQFVVTKDLLHSKELLAEPRPAIQAALPRAVRLVVASLTELAGKTSGRELLWRTAQESATGTMALSADAGLVKSVLDDRYHGSVHEIATQTGVKPGSVMHLLEVVTFGALSVINQLVAEQGWNAQQLGAWLRPHQLVGADSVPAAAPFAAPLAVSSAPETLAPSRATEPWLAKGANKLLVAMSLLAAAEFGYILNLKLSDQPDAIATQAEPNLSAPSASEAYTAQPVSNVTAVAPPLTAVTSSDLAVPVVLKLKDGLKQINAANSTETKLYEFLIDPSVEVNLADPSKGWIGFDRIYFESSKAILTNESLWQLSNVASILKRFPASKIKIGGYTDSSGNPLRNLKLSKERADAAMASLVSLGVPADHIVAVGYGALDNIATNDTEEGRALNRRVSMQVIQK